MAEALDKPEPAATRRPRRRSPEELRRAVYEMGDLSAYGFRDRLLIRAADLTLTFLLRALGPTLRWQTRGVEHLEEIYASGRRAIFTSWHETIFGAACYWRDRGIVVMSSTSRDAEYIARSIKRIGYGTVRGSATRGGMQALAEMRECLAEGMDVSFMIDGPRGPALIAKPGAVTLARHSGHAILPFHVTFTKRWMLPSWDRLQIPKPFTPALLLVGEPIYVERQAGNQESAAKQEEVQAALMRLREEAEAWVASRCALRADV